MKKLESRGFSIVETLLLIVLIGIIAGVGWYVWKQNELADDQVKSTSESNVQPTTSKPAPTCDTADEVQKTWVLASSKNDVFDMCIPGGWALTSDTESDTFVVLPPFTVSSNEKAKIKSEAIGGKDGTADMFQVFSAEKSYQGWTSEKDSEKSEFVLNDGTKGTRYYTQHTNVGEGIGPVEGEEDYEYLFEKNDKFIHAVYTIHPGTEKSLEQVESALKTLSIN